MRKNAFTLVELLAVLVIIGILSAISIAIYSNSIVESKKSLSDFQKRQLIESARTYVAVNTIDFNNIFDSMATEDNDSCVALAIKVLIKEGLISQEVVDPQDTSTQLDGYIKIKYDTSTSQYEYNYENESYASSICKYKIWVENGEVKHTD